MDNIIKWFSSEENKTKVFIVLAALFIIVAFWGNKNQEVKTDGVAIAISTDQVIPQGKKVYLTVHNNTNSFVKVYEGKVVGSIKDKRLLIIIIKDDTIRGYMGKYNIDLTL